MATTVNVEQERKDPDSAECDDIERHLPLWPSLLLFAIDGGTSISLGVLLNIATTNYHVGVAGFFLFSSQCLCHFLSMLIAGIGPHIEFIKSRFPYRERSVRYRRSMESSRDDEMGLSNE